LRAIENGEKIFVYSERRFGKTSLVRIALEKLPQKKYLTAYVDLWPTDGECSFITVTAKAIAESMSTKTDKILELAKTFFSRLTPSITVDEQGKPKVTFGIGKLDNMGPELDEVLSAPAKIAAQRKQKVAIVFDEFQQILEYGNDLVERRLRSIIQHHRDICYIFLGSRKHLIQKMFLDRSRPLYRSGGHYPLGPISEKDWLPFIRQKFIEAGKYIGDEQIHKIFLLTEGHPFYTQHLSHALWDLCEQGTKISDDLVETAVQILLDRESYAYTTLWEALTLSQRRLLKGLATESSGIRIFASRFIQKYGLSSASTAQRAVESLLEKDIIDRDNGSFVIVDRFFKVWVKRIQESKGI